MQGNGGRENHIRDVSPCEFGRIISAQTPPSAAECGCNELPENDCEDLRASRLYSQTQSY
jgi:hypothetical protein